MASVGLPVTSGFVGEFMVLTGVYQTVGWVSAGLATGLILGAAYALLLYRRVMFGPVTKEDVKTLTDLDLREKSMFALLVVMVLWMGIYPKPFLHGMDASVSHLLSQLER